MMIVLWFSASRKSGVICVRVPVHSGRSSGQYESSPDIKRYLVSAPGNINHTLFSSYSLMMPPQPCGQLWTVARETRAKAAGSQWKPGRPGYARASRYCDHISTGRRPDRAGCKGVQAALAMASWLLQLSGRAGGGKRTVKPPSYSCSSGMFDGLSFQCLEFSSIILQPNSASVPHVTDQYAPIFHLLQVWT